MKTILEWYNDLPEDFEGQNVRAKAIAAYDPAFNDGGFPINNLADAIYFGFDWGKNGGSDYWLRIEEHAKAGSFSKSPDCSLEPRESDGRHPLDKTAREIELLNKVEELENNIHAIKTETEKLCRSAWSAGCTHESLAKRGFRKEANEWHIEKWIEENLLSRISK